LAGSDASAAPRAWGAARRLRELIPLLPLGPHASEKIIGRLRRHLRRVEAVRQLGRLLQIVDQLDGGRPVKRPISPSLRDHLRGAADLARADLARRRSSHDAARIAAKLSDVVEALRREGADRKRSTDIAWAARARVARRGSDLKAAIEAAGSVYLPQRLAVVHAAVRKLRYGTELAEHAGAHVAPSDLRLLVRVDRLLDEIDDRQALVARVRQLQGGLAIPDLKAWRDLDTVVLAVENRCCELHARYLADRELVLGACERLFARVPAEGRARRRAS
jgi:hypothetical protein